MNDLTDIAICGGGIVGLTAALALAFDGSKVTIFAPPPKTPDKRTTAIMADSKNYLEEIGLWSDVASNAHPLRTMRIIDGTRRLVRLQHSEFHAGEIGLDAFAFNVGNDVLSEALIGKLQALENVEIIELPVDYITVEDREKPLIVTSDMKLEAGFLVGADGRNSLVRSAYRYGEKTWQYPQTAVVVDFEHKVPSGDASTEFHTETGPFTIVPRGPNQAGLVWLNTPEEADRIREMSIDELNLHLESEMHSFLGAISIIGQMHTFPIMGLQANRYGEGRHALVGEAAHVFPPIGAQGFNLGVRDIRKLAEILRRHTIQENPGAIYHRSRFVDISTRTMGVDLLNRSLLQEKLLVQMARSGGMWALNNLGLLRKQVMKLGVAPISFG